MITSQARDRDRGEDSLRERVRMGEELMREGGQSGDGSGAWWVGTYATVVRIDVK